MRLDWTTGLRKAGAWAQKCLQGSGDAVSYTAVVLPRKTSERLHLAVSVAAKSKRSGSKCASNNLRPNFGKSKAPVSALRGASISL